MLRCKIQILVCLVFLWGSGVSYAQKFRTIENKAYKKGEKLSFKIYYGFVAAGAMDIVIDNEWSIVNNRKCYQIKGFGRTTGAVDWFFKVRDYYTTFIDSQAIFPHRFIRDVTEGSYKKLEVAEFDHVKNIAINNKTQVVQMTENFQDIFSAYYYSRCLNTDKLVPGDTIKIFAYLDAALNTFHLKFEGRELLKTNHGKFRCLKFKPQIQLGRVFREEGGLTIWVSDDANHIPLKVEAKLKVGNITVELDSYSGLANPVTSKVN